jgi:hypothetical protein
MIWYKHVTKRCHIIYTSESFLALPRGRRLSTICLMFVRPYFGWRDCIRARTLAGGTRIGLYLGVRKYSASKSLTALRGWRITDIFLLLGALCGL